MTGTPQADHECDGKPVYFRVIYALAGGIRKYESDYCCMATVPDRQAWPAEAEPVQVCVNSDGIETVITGDTVQITTTLESYAQVAP